MRKGRRSAERLSYWPELGSRALTRREQEMPRSFAVNQVFSDGGGGGDFAGAGSADGVDVFDQVAGTRASAHHNQRHGVSS